MSDTKWADVAHYYLKSGIYITWKTIFDNRELVAPIGTMSLDSLTTMPDVKPILRHRDDMTEADAMSLWKSVTNRVEFSDSVYAAYGSPLVIYRSKFKALQPEEFHCAVQLGFDVFGLIESGQAIRKEMGNG